MTHTSRCQPWERGIPFVIATREGEQLFAPGGVAVDSRKSARRGAVLYVSVIPDTGGTFHTLSAVIELKLGSASAFVVVEGSTHVLVTDDCSTVLVTSLNGAYLSTENPENVNEDS